MKSLALFDTPLGNITATVHESDEYKDLYVELERPDGSCLQMCVVTYHDGGLQLLPYNTTDEVTDDCDDVLHVRTDDDRWY